MTYSKHNVPKHPVLAQLGRLSARGLKEWLARRRWRAAADCEPMVLADEARGGLSPWGDKLAEVADAAARQGVANQNQGAPLVLNLALQGGGTHGAFTWGVLDRLLDDERITIEGVSGASAGAINATLLVSGWLAEGRAGARRALAAFWTRLADLAPPPAFQALLRPLTQVFSPYQLNPLDLNPLRDLLAGLIDVERIREARAPQLFVSATNIQTGEGRIFRNPEMSVEVVLASACLPQLHKAVHIGDSWFWDGGFSSNPPLLPLAEHCRARDLLLVQLTPGEITGLPVTVPTIRQRLGQIVFNAPLQHELRVLETRSACDGVRLHRIDATSTVELLGPDSAGHPDRDLLTHLHERGYAAADKWLVSRHRQVVGRETRVGRA